jgi:exosortase
VLGVLTSAVVIAYTSERSATRSISPVKVLHALAIAVIAALIVALYTNVAASMAVDWWTVPSLSQGMLIPPLVLVLVFQHRARIFAEPAKPDEWGLLIVGFACVLFLIGKLAAEFFVWRISFVVLLAGLIWTFWGQRRLRSAAFELVLLATMVPLPALVYNSLSAPLQLFASDAATAIAQSAGTVAYRDGNIIYLAATTLGVEEACSGLNSLSALMVASVLLSFSTCSHGGVRVALFLLTFPISVAVNVFRVAGTAILTDWNEQFAYGFYHLFSGWLVFVFGLVLLYITARLLESGRRRWWYRKP